MVIDLNSKDCSAGISGLIDAALEARNKKEAPRNYIGGSRLGHPCARALQYEYFHTPKDQDFSGRTLRIFHRGHEGEDRMIRYLRMAGFDLRTEGKDGNQFGFSICGGRIQGHCDGVLCGGPEHFGPYPRLWENKVLGAKGWRKVASNRVQKAYPIYYGQVQVYQAYLDLADNLALFTAVNADTEEIYAEAVPFAADVAQELSDKGARILQACDAGELLPRISDDPTWFECKWCDYGSRCHA